MREEWDKELQHFAPQSHGRECTMNSLRVCTGTNEGVLGLRLLWWSLVIRTITLGQAVPPTMDKHRPPLQKTYLAALSWVGAPIWTVNVQETETG